MTTTPQSPPPTTTPLKLIFGKIYYQELAELDRFHFFHFQVPINNSILFILARFALINSEYYNESKLG